MKRGEIWRIRLPSRSGHAQRGERPAIIVQADAYNASLPTVLIVPFTSSLAAARFAGTLTIQPDGQNGLTMPSVALVFQLIALDKGDCLHPLGNLDSATLDRTLEILDHLTGR